MVNTRSIARLGVLAVGLGIGAAWAHTPVASADTSTDLLSSIDSLLGGGGLSALSDPSGLNLAISFDGMSLVQEGSATATTTSGDFDLAIASGAGSDASATGGTGDYALADGTDALAKAGDSAAGATGSNSDSAIDIGNNADPSTYPGAPDGAYAGAGSLIGGTDSTGTDSNDTAIDIGNNGVSTDASFPGDGGNTGAFAGDGQLIGASGAGNDDTAINFGNDNGFGDGPAAVDGTDDFASQSGDSTGTNLGSFAGVGNDDIASEIGPNSSTYAGGDIINGTTGNNDIAYVLDPTGVDGSEAFAGWDPLTPGVGAVGSSDLAGVNFVDDVIANATGANNLTTILPALSAEATTGSSFLADLLPSLGESATSSGSNFLADLASLF
jgi:hypothetical protein